MTWTIGGTHQHVYIWYLRANGFWSSRFCIECGVSETKGK